MAETLITLAIIGIIAAMTVPTLMAKANEHAWRSAFLKNYAVIKQAYALAVRDDNHFLNAQVTKEKDIMNGIKDYFKVAKGPYQHIGIKSSGDFTEIFYGTTKKPKEFFKSLNGEPDKYWGNGTRYSFQLDDGTIIVVSGNYGLATTRGIFVDVNGTKGPNTYGKDIYFLTVQSFSDLPFFDQVVPIGIKDTPAFFQTSAVIYFSEPENDCTKNGAGYFCAREIIRDHNYKIK